MVGCFQNNWTPHSFAKHFTYWTLIVPYLCFHSNEITHFQHHLQNQFHFRLIRTLYPMKYGWKWTKRKKILNSMIIFRENYESLPIFIGFSSAFKYTLRTLFIVWKTFSWPNFSFTHLLCPYIFWQHIWIIWFGSTEIGKEITFNLIIKNRFKLKLTNSDKLLNK